MTGPLSDDQLAHVVRFAPLVCVDLIVKDQADKVLVGLRTNEPARGSYFVPGGRIRKDETIKDAFARILRTEIGCCFAFEAARFLGVFEHFYPDDQKKRSGYGTHSVILGYEVKFDRRLSRDNLDENGATIWMRRGGRAGR